MESAIGEALKTKRRKTKYEKTIRVCDECSIPLIWTFAFAYKERYCLNCGASGGMLGTGKDVPATREIIFQKKLVDAVWGVIYSRKGLVPSSSQRTNCNKCKKSSEYHIKHLTKIEQEDNEIARNYLDQFKGFLNPPQ